MEERVDREGDGRGLCSDDCDRQRGLSHRRAHLRHLDTRIGNHVALSLSGIDVVNDRASRPNSTRTVGAIVVPETRCHASSTLLGAGIDTGC